MYNVTCKILVVQECNSQSMHSRIMSFEKPLYVISACHTLIRHITFSKLNLEG